MIRNLPDPARVATPPAADPARVGTRSEPSEPKDAPAELGAPRPKEETQEMNTPSPIEPSYSEPVPLPPEPSPQTTPIVPVQTAHPAQDSSLGGRSFSSDIPPAPPSAVLTPEVLPAEPQTSRHSAKPRRKSRASSAPKNDKKQIRVALPTGVALKPRQSGDISLNHHEAHCAICQHPERDAIEQAFLRWWHPAEIAYHFKLGHKLLIYRHAHAFRLLERRLARSRHALEIIVEQVQSVTPTADSIIRAVRAMSCLDDSGRWTEPPKRVIITHEFPDTPHAKKTA